MARQGLLPSDIGKVHATRQTPHVATFILLAVLVPLVLVGDIKDLASATVLLLLTVFAIMNSALYILQRRPGEPEGRLELPSIIPLLGALSCAVLIVFRVATGDWRAPAIAGTLLAGILLVYRLLEPARERAG
jgi:amino acid transporter